jgi:hypothetical protein
MRSTQPLAPKTAFWIIVALVLLGLCFMAAPAFTQSLVNPVTGIRWSQTSGSGAPSGSTCPYTATGTLAIGTKNVTAIVPTSLFAGLAVTGTGIPANTTLVGVNVGLSTATLSQNATASGAQSLSFYPLGQPYVDVAGGTNWFCTQAGWKAQAGTAANPAGASGQVQYNAGGVFGAYASGVPIAYGGTGATTAAGALANLGALPLTGGTLTGALLAPSITLGSGSGVAAYLDFSQGTAPPTQPANSARLQAPASIATSYECTLPTAAPSSGNTYLTCPLGGGQMTWSASVAAPLALSMASGTTTGMYGGSFTGSGYAYAMEALAPSLLSGNNINVFLGTSFALHGGTFLSWNNAAFPYASVGTFSSGDPVVLRANQVILPTTYVGQSFSGAALLSGCSGGLAVGTSGQTCIASSGVTTISAANAVPLSIQNTTSGGDANILLTSNGGDAWQLTASGSGNANPEAFGFYDPTSRVGPVVINGLAADPFLGTIASGVIGFTSQAQYANHATALITGLSNCSSALADCAALGNGTATDSSGSLYLGVLGVTAATPSVGGSGQLLLGNTTASTATAGGATLPSAPATFLSINLNNATYKVPLYAN